MLLSPRVLLVRFGVGSEELRVVELLIREHRDPYLGDGRRLVLQLSGTMCPFVGKALAMAYIDRSHAEEGTELEVDVRGRRVAAKIVPLPFYSRKK